MPEYPHRGVAVVQLADLGLSRRGRRVRLYYFALVRSAKLRRWQIVLQKVRLNATAAQALSIIIKSLTNC
jgi:hypothetical protein